MKILLKTNLLLASAMILFFSNINAQGYVFTEPMDGITVMEAEHYYGLIEGSEGTGNQGYFNFSGGNWAPETVTPGYTGTEYMKAPNFPSGIGNDNDDILAFSPAIVFRINFTQTGNHFWYARCTYDDGSSDSYHIGMGDSILFRKMNPWTQIAENYGTWGWNFNTASGTPAIFNVPTVGEHELVVYMREPNFKLDKIVIVTSPADAPSGLNTTGPAETPSILPVELTSFEVQKSNDGVIVDWNTKNEINSMGYSLMHSEDGVNWKEFAFVESQSLEALSDTYYYQYTHDNYVHGNNYYRLIQQDFDGKQMKSQIRQIHIDSGREIQGLLVYPTMTENILNVSLGNENLNYDYSIYNQLGQKKLQGTLNGTSRHKIELYNLPSGSYFINFINDNNEHFSYPFIKN